MRTTGAQVKMKKCRLDEDEDLQVNWCNRNSSSNNNNNNNNQVNSQQLKTTSMSTLSAAPWVALLLGAMLLGSAQCQKTRSPVVVESGAGGGGGGGGNSSSRPLERPSLNLVVTRRSSLSNDSTSGPPTFPEGAADWFMMGGAADLATDESRPATSHGKRRVISSTRRMAEVKQRRSGSAGKQQHQQQQQANNKTISFDDDSTAAASTGSESSDSSTANDIYDDPEESGSSMAGTQKEPECATHGRYYCTFKEDYPLKLVTEVTKYYKWPLEKLFRDLHAQIMPKLAQDSTGNLVCDSVTRVVRPGWARNTNERWLVVINTDNYHQYVTEVVCQYGTNSRCNFIPPCYYSSCQQRYNTQKLLVIDPTNPYRGPFLSEFLFPSCCVCYVPSTSESLQDKYRSSPATIYQRTMQQEAASNLNPPQFRPPGLSLLEEAFSSAVGGGGGGGVSSTGESRVMATSQQGSGANGLVSSAKATPSQQPPGPGEIRRAGELRLDERHGRQLLPLGDYATGSGCPSCHTYDSSFPRLGLDDSLISSATGSGSGAGAGAGAGASAGTNQKQR